MRALLLAFAGVLVTCAPSAGGVGRDEPPAHCTGSRTYERTIERLTSGSASRALVRYRERTLRRGAALHIVRTVEFVEGDVDSPIAPIPTDAERTVGAPFFECPTLDSPVVAGDLRVRTRLLHVTTTW